MQWRKEDLQVDCHADTEFSSICGVIKDKGSYKILFEGERAHMRLNLLNKQVWTYSAMRIKLTAIIARSQVDLCLVNKTNNLCVVRSPHELDTGESARRNDTTSMTWLRAPRDLLLFSLTDGCRTVWRCPKTKVYQFVTTLHPKSTENTSYHQ
jgi:hypothetical protein